MNNCCSLNSKDETQELLLMQIKREVKNLIEETDLKILNLDGKINDICVYVKDNLSNYLREQIDTMNYSGELDDIVLDALTTLESHINNMIVYYGNDIYVENLHDNISDCDYYVTHIPSMTSKNECLNLRVGIANDNESLSTLESTVSFAQRKNATICFNAGYYNVNTFRPIGGIIKDGEIVDDSVAGSDKYNYIAIDQNNNLKCYPYNTSLKRMISDGIVQAVCGTYKLIEDSIPIVQTDTSKEPRQAIGQKLDGEFIIISCDGRDAENSGMSIDDLIRLFKSYDVINAYNLDGGGSTSTVLRGIKQNDNIDGVDRKVSNFFYVKKEVVDDELQIINQCFNEIGKLKETLMSLSDIDRGYLKLKGKDGFFFPGVEFYSNASEKRLGKLGYQDREDVLRSVYATLRDEDGNEQTVFRGTKEGLYNSNGLMANFLAYPRRVPNEDCNIKGVPASIYYMYEADQNSPANGIGACYLLHLPFDSNLNINIRQIAIPMNEGRTIRCRSCNSQGEWTAWYELGVAKGNTSERPKGLKAGAMYWDTTLRKPIWYTGAVWVDAAGNNV